MTRESAASVSERPRARRQSPSLDIGSGPVVLLVIVLALSGVTGAVADPAGSIEPRSLDSGVAQVGPIFNLGAPRVVKLDWSTRAVVPTDLDRDGRTDLALINNDSARIELLYQRRPGEKVERTRRSRSERWEPELEDSLFRREGLATGARMFDLVAADLDGDGRTDLAYTGRPDALTVRYQRSKGEFKKRRVFDIEDPVGWSDSLLAADLDGDGRSDLAVITEKRLLVFRQSSAGELVGPRSYALSDDGCYGLRALDVDHDGRPDLVFQASNRNDSLRVRFGQKDGFGPEQAFAVKAPRGLVEPIAVPPAGELGMALVDSSTGMLRVLGFADEDDSEDQEALLKHIRPRLFSSRVEGKTPPSYVTADLDGDGDLDLVIADPRGARIWTMLQEDPGIFGEAMEYPALSDIRSLTAADTDGDGRAEIVMASPGERAVAVAGLSDKGRLSYPSPLPSTGKPGGVVAADLDGDGSTELVYFYEERRQRGVVVLRLDEAGEWRPLPVEIPELKITPRAITSVDANQDGRPDIALFVPNEPMILLIQSEEGVLVAAGAEDGFRQGLLDDIQPSAFSTGDVDGDGKPEMLVAGKGFARAMRVESGVLTVVDQYNARASDTEIAAAAVLDLDVDGAAEIVLIEAGGESAQVLRRGRDEVFRFYETVRIDGLEVLGVGVEDLDGDGRVDLIVLGSDRFAWWPLGADDLTVVERVSFEPGLEDVSYHLIGIADLNADGSAEIVAIDSRDSHVMELLSRGSDGSWQSVMHFTIFEVDPHYEGQQGATLEPREVVASDLTGDGKVDLALLVHDRVLVYPQLDLE